jgi:hypothetical protein
MESMEYMFAEGVPGGYDGPSRHARVFRSHSTLKTLFATRHIELSDLREIGSTRLWRRIPKLVGYYQVGGPCLLCVDNKTVLHPQGSDTMGRGMGACGCRDWEAWGLPEKDINLCRGESWLEMQYMPAWISGSNWRYLPEFGVSNATSTLLYWKWPLIYSRHLYDLDNPRTTTYT